MIEAKPIDKLIHILKNIAGNNLNLQTSFSDFEEFAIENSLKETLSLLV